jgi:nitrous oxide reductase accessory protein NosL
MTQTIATPKTIESWLQALTCAMTIEHRPDGSSFYKLSEAACWQPIRQQLQDVVRAAHRDEMPNDWRYSMVESIAQALLEYSEPDSQEWTDEQYADVVFYVADALASYGTCELADWVSDNAGRGFFDDPSLVQGLVCDIPTMLRWRQTEEIQLMALVLLKEFGNLCA